jgi:predicted SAM-dependent methyltransferase
MMPADDTLLSRFPKQRPHLPDAYRKIYAQHYTRNREGGSAASSLAQKMESWMHRKVADDIARRPRDCSTLEIGAGNLNHVPYEPETDRYDVVEALTDVVERSYNRVRIRYAYRDLSEIRDKEYDRIISIAAFEHYCDLPDVVAHCVRLLAPRGQLRVAVPSEGTLLWTLGWKLTTGLEFRLKYGLDYGVLMRHEHVNTAREIEGVLCAFFKSVKRSVFGISAGLSFYQFFECGNGTQDAQRRVIMASQPRNGGRS